MVALAPHLRQVVGERAVLRAPLDQRQIAAQSGQSVAQLVRHAGGQLAQLGQALRQPLLGGLPAHLGEVDEEDQEATHGAVVTAHSNRIDDSNQQPAVQLSHRFTERFIGGRIRNDL